MITEEHFRPEHWPEIQPQPGVSVPADPRREHLERLARNEFAVTVRMDGRAVAFLGVVDVWPGRGECWAVLDGNCTRAFCGIDRIARRYLFEVLPHRRIEATVECDFIAGHRWVRMLGFHQEAARMRGYLPDGKDCALYARVK